MVDETKLGLLINNFKLCIFKEKKATVVHVTKHTVKPGMVFAPSCAWVGGVDSQSFKI